MNLTVPLATLLDLAERPGEIPGIGPADPWLARDLAWSAAQNPKTTWCVTVTDEHGHAIGHGCARPEPRNHRKEPAERRNPARRPGAIRRAGPAAPRGRGSPSRPPARTARRADTGAGGSRPGAADRGISWSRSTRSPPRTVITGSRPRATTPASSSGTCPRSAMPPAPGWPAEDPQHSPISNTTSPTRPVAERVCVMADRSAGTTTASSRTPAGTSTSSPTVPSAGPPRPAASTPPNPPATPSR